MKSNQKVIFLAVIPALIIIGVLLYYQYFKPVGLHIIYYADPNEWTLKKERIIQIRKNLDLARKLEILADSLSAFRFNNLPIKIDTIKMVEGKIVALVNLKEHSRHDEKDKGVLLDKSQSSWSGNYFQGSTGGWCTTNALRETLLQPEYKGKWIDGVEFLYESETLENWDHVTLYGIQYRGQGE